MTPVVGLGRGICHASPFNIMSKVIIDTQPFDTVLLNKVDESDYFVVKGAAGNLYQIRLSEDKTYKLYSFKTKSVVQRGWGEGFKAPQKLIKLLIEAEFEVHAFKTEYSMFKWIADNV